MLANCCAVLCWCATKMHVLFEIDVYCVPRIRKHSKSVTTSRSYKYTRPGVHFMSPGLLQLFAVRSDRQTHAAISVQSVQNAAARLITGAKRRELPVKRQVEFKMASLVYQVLSSNVPGYLADDFISPQELLLAPSVLFGEKVLCHYCSQWFWWQMFWCSWTTYRRQSEILVENLDFFHYSKCVLSNDHFRWSWVTSEDQGTVSGFIVCI